jgi:predicted RNA-binding protein YlxR (DUF448 family)
MAEKKIPQRMCTGCGEMKDKNLLLRVVLTPVGEILLDKKGKVSGRGAYVCKSAECLKKAIKTKRLERNLKTAISQEVYDRLAEEING